MIDHPTNASWHFVNLPLGAAGYPVPDPASGDPMRAFVGPDDIMHALQQAIAILETPTAPADFSKAQAVRWLVRLVGDLHTAPARDHGLLRPERREVRHQAHAHSRTGQSCGGRCPGGPRANGLLFSASEANNLHALWDKCLPGMVAGATCSNPGAEYTALAQVLTQGVTRAATAAAGTQEDHHG